MRSAESLAELFVQIADTLVADFDVVEFLQHLTDRCVEFVEVDAAGLVLADKGGRLELMAHTTDQVRLLELFQLHNEEGPCLDCYRTGHSVSVADMASATQRWPRFARVCQHLGYRSVLAIPLRRRTDVIGAMNLFRRTAGEKDPATVRIAQALTDVATIGLLQQRAHHEQSTMVEHLQTALSSRVIIEQAKGVLSERLGLDPERAFTLLRRHARNHNHRLTDLARAVIDGTDDLYRTIGANQERA